MRSGDWCGDGSAGDRSVTELGSDITSPAIQSSTRFERACRPLAIAVMGRLDCRELVAARYKRRDRSTRRRPVSELAAVVESPAIRIAGRRKAARVCVSTGKGDEGLTPAHEDR